EDDRRLAVAARAGQLGGAEVETAGGGQVPGRLLGDQQQRPEGDPVVGAHRGGAVGAAGRVLVEGAGAPDVLAGAMDLGVVGGPDVVAVPAAARDVFEEPCRGGLQEVGAPGAVLDEGFQGLPVAGSVEGDQGLGDGVLLDVEGQPGDPRGEAREAGPGAAQGVTQQQLLPEGPQSLSFHATPRRGGTGMGNDPGSFARRGARVQYASGNHKLKKSLTAIPKILETNAYSEERD